MYQFILGFVAGVYVGTKYNCKPAIDKATELIKEHFPKEN